MSEIQGKIVNWYKKNKRDLPWRNSKSAYHIWLSEIIMQQTQIKQGTPYYIKFISEFPTIDDLANAKEEKIMSMWQGLGYYSRARNLHSTAKIITQEYSGIFPSSPKEIIKLKGIGEYTCAAISTFAFNNPLPLVDGNVYRLYSRLFNIPTEINTPKGQKEFKNLATKLLSEIPTAKAVLYNEAIMEFGSLVCTPKQPKCESCPIELYCLSKKEGNQSSLPNKKPAKRKITRNLEFLFKYNDEGFWIQKREDKDIWQGLYQFILLEDQNKKLTKSNITLNKDSNIIIDQNSVKHILSHQILHIKYHTQYSELTKSMDGYLHCSWDNISQFGFPKPLATFIDNFQKK